ncbi:alpha-L-arabinofuranosidase [Mucilaginibacter sp. FT3.2]|uniref:alpha-L-arabinofuranosidase n=1 Tax=Mucilaginibacter sp. FT3.2 TaxID=2723090 RepID=UPI0016118D2F|nr:alpha-L-arabinofuranosidase [Mucilaginibacter sp. FT3.2]MBB6231548.1 hypothetical protein [Mucilaginibacter sp. FT3.2]
MKLIIKHISVIIVIVIVLQACTKAKTPDTTIVTTDTGNGGATGSITSPTDPSVAVSQGFFLDNWEAKTFTKPSVQNAAKPTTTASVTVTADFANVVSKVSKNLFGNNINPFTGQYTDAGVVNNLTNLSPNIIRAPGGSLSDVYFYDLPSGGKPADVPAELLKADGTPDPTTGYWSGLVTDSWSISLNNYYSLLQKINSTGIITVNYGYARYGLSDHPVETAAHYAAQWVRNDKGRTKLWEVGNENYGNWEAGYRIDVTKNKDGQPEILTGQLYGTHFKVFADSMRKAASDIGATIKIGIVLTETNDQSNSVGVQNWNAGVLSSAGSSPDFFVVHNYYTPYNENSTPETILATPSSVTSSMLSWVNTSIQTAGIAPKPIAMDEWNIFASGSRQQVSYVAGVHAVLVLGELIKNQVSMACRWDLANGGADGNDHGLFTYQQTGTPDFTPRPAFYYLYYFQKYFGDRMISSVVTGSTNIVSYASSFNSGEAGVTLVNKGTTDQVVNINFKNYYTGANYYYYTLKGGADNAPYSGIVTINGNSPSGSVGGPSNYTAIAASSSATSGGILVTVPARGVVFLVCDKK